MAHSSILEMIARREEDLRGKLMAARAEADALLADAMDRAKSLRAEGERAAAAEANRSVAEGLAAAQREAEERVSRTERELASFQTDERRLHEAAQFIVDAVLLRSPQPGSELQAGSLSVAAPRPG